VPSRVAVAGIGLVAAAVLSSPAWAPALLRDVEWFSVRRVEISGTRLLAPREVLAAADLPEGHNLWNPLAAVERSVLRHPSIDSVAVSRKPPHTLRIRVHEKRPVAFVEIGALAAVTARGEILPVDPTRVGLDLPLVRGAWLEMEPSSREAVLRVLEALRSADPELLAQTSELRPVDPRGGAVRLEHASAEILLPGSVDGDRLSRLRAVLEDLQRRAPGREVDASIPTVDARFEDQIVVRLQTSVS
jgi:cell division protein FtsQ